MSLPFGRSRGTVEVAASQYHYESFLERLSGPGMILTYTRYGDFFPERTTLPLPGPGVVRLFFMSAIL